MLAIRAHAGVGTRRGGRATLPSIWLLGLGALLVALLAGTPAHAITYFDGPSGLGFDNSSLMLDIDYEIPTDEMNPSYPFEFIAGGVIDGVPVGLGVEEVINEEPGLENIDRTITFTIYNNDALSDLLIVLTFLGATDFDYSGNVIDVDIDSLDPMDVASWGPLVTFAGYALTLDDFEEVGGRLVTTRQFRYTVDIPQDGTGPPALSVALTREFSVPEPATGLLLAGSLLVAVRAGRKRRA